MRIVMLGGSGNAGRAIATLLAPTLGSGDELVIAGRDRDRLAAAREAVVTAARVETRRVDLDDRAASRAALDGAGLVIVTAARPDLVGALAREALEAGADWFDTLLSTATKWEALRRLEPRIQASGRCFVTDGGFHPGLPAVLARRAAEYLDELHTADVMAGLRIDWKADTLADSTVDEMLDEFSDFDLTAWVDGRQQRLRWSQCPRVDFGPPIGSQVVVPMPLEEMRLLPELLPGLRRCGLYITGFGPVMDYLVLPVVTLLAPVRRLRPAVRRLTRWSMGRLATAPPPHRLVVQLDAEGRKDGSPARVRLSVAGEDGYLVTAAPAVACLRQLRDGTIRRPGLHLQGHLVEPGPTLAALAEAGLEVVDLSR